MLLLTSPLAPLNRVRYNSDIIPSLLNPLQSSPTPVKGDAPLSDVSEIILIILAALILAVVWKVSKVAGEKFLTKAADEAFWRWSIGRELVLVVRGILFLVAISIVLVVLGFDLLAVVGSPTIIALLLGVVLTPLIGLLINGLSLRYGRRFDQNDVVIFPGSGFRGIVEDFSLTHVKIISLDNEYRTIPTWRIRNTDVINCSRNGNARRQYIDVLVTYDSSVDAAQNALKNAAKDVAGVIDAVRNDDYVVDDKMRMEIHDDISVCLDPRCRIEQFADSGIMLRLYFWVEEPAPIARIKSEILEKINAAEGSDFHFAFPHRRVLGTGDEGEIKISGLLDKKETKCVDSS